MIRFMLTTKEIHVSGLSEGRQSQLIGTNAQFQHSVGENSFGFVQTDNVSQAMAKAFSRDELAGNSDPQLFGVLSFIYKHIGDRLLIEEMALSLGISRRTLYRQVFRATGLTPTQLVRLARLRFAQHLLRTTEIKITDVALAAGYSSSSQFCKHIQQHEGISPREYRRIHRPVVESNR